MAIRVEDGTIVARANSWVTVEEVQEYASDRGMEFDGSVEEKEAAIIKAADYLRDEKKFQYRGTRTSASQYLPWPRTGATIYRGPAIGSNEIPVLLKEAQCYLAIRALTEDIQPDLARGGQVKRKTVGPITTEWYDGAPVGTLYQVALGMLEPLLQRTPHLEVFPHLAQYEDQSPFRPGEFNFPPSPLTNG